MSFGDVASIIVIGPGLKEARNGGSASALARMPGTRYHRRPRATRRA